jgi:hypothetical protein
MRRASNGLGWGSKSTNFAPTNGGRAKICREWNSVAAGGTTRVLILIVESTALKPSTEGPSKLKVLWRMSTSSISTRVHKAPCGERKYTTFPARRCRLQSSSIRKVCEPCLDGKGPSEALSDFRRSLTSNRPRIFPMLPFVVGCLPPRCRRGTSCWNRRSSSKWTRQRER